MLLACVDGGTPDAPSPALRNGFVRTPLPGRIGVYANDDGTLWSESPLYFQLMYAMAYVQKHADAHPEWRGQQPYEAVIEGDQKALAAAGEQGIIELVLTSHTGMTTEAFDAAVRDYLETAKHPTRGRILTELVDQPMLELLDDLRANRFETWIVSGVGSDFLRAFSEEVYGAPPDQIVGSSVALVHPFELETE